MGFSNVKLQLKLVRLTGILFFLLTSIKSSYSEFRFCYNGPHKFTAADCPGGILFKKSVPTSCTYYFKTKEMPDTRVTINGDSCDSSIAEDADVNEASPIRSFSIAKLQEIIFEIGEGETPGVETSTQTECQATCLSSYVDPTEFPALLGGSEQTEDSKEQVYQFPVPTPEIIAAQENFTEQLISYLVLDERPAEEDVLNKGRENSQKGEEGGSGADDGSDPEPTFKKKDLRIVNLLRRSFDVMSAYCTHTYIPQSYIRKTMDAMIFLLEHTNVTIRDIGVREYEQILGILGQCKTYDPWNTFRIIGDECIQQPIIKGAKYTAKDGEEKTYMYGASEFPFAKFDPFIESSWSAVAFVHGNCFDASTPEFNLHHVYTVAMESLFNIKPILERWVVAPMELGEKSFWNNILEVFDYKTVRLNVNACSKIAYAFNPYKRVLERPFKQINGTWADISPAVASSTGFTGTEQEYWAQYDFRNVLNLMGGTCYMTETDREADLSVITANCEKLREAQAAAASV